MLPFTFASTLLHCGSSAGDSAESTSYAKASKTLLRSSFPTPAHASTSLAGDSAAPPATVPSSHTRRGIKRRPRIGSDDAELEFVGNPTEAEKYQDKSTSSDSTPTYARYRTPVAQPRKRPPVYPVERLGGAPSGFNSLHAAQPSAPAPDTI